MGSATTARDVGVTSRCGSITALLLGSLAVGACLAPPEPTRARGNAETPTDADAPPAASSAGLASSTGCTLSPGSSTHEIDVDGVARGYSVHVGPEVRGPAPAVFVWHGFGGSPRIARRITQGWPWPGAIVVAPQGLPRTFPDFGPTEQPGWQIAAGEHDDRDLKLFDALRASLVGQGCVDPGRVYSTGFSNGGFFSNVLACHRPDAVAAVAPVGGGGPFAKTCGAAVPTLVVHGTADDVVPFDEGAKTFARRLTLNGCGATSAPERGCADGPECTEAVRMCSHGGRHTWPAETVDPILSFFQAHGGG